MIRSMKKSRLSHYKQDRFTKHFVLGSIARTTASLCGVNRQTAAFCFFQLREIIAYELEAKQCLAEKLKLMKTTYVAGGKENAGAVLQVKS